MDMGVGLGDGEPVLDDVTERFFGGIAVGQGEEGAHVALGETGVSTLLQDGAGEAEEAKFVGDAALAFAETMGKVGLSEMICDGKCLERKGFFEEIEVGALEVFQESEKGGLLVGCVNEQAGDGGESGGDGGAEAALAGDEVEAIALLAEGERLEDTVFLDGGGELGESEWVEVAAGLVGGRKDLIGGDVVNGFCVEKWWSLWLWLKKHSNFTSEVGKMKLPYFGKLF